MKKRVKCANCGMVYDLLLNPCNYSGQEEQGHCPKCGSNAYDGGELEWKKGQYA